MPLVTVLAEVEWQGIMVDTTFLAALSGDYTGKLNIVSQDIYTLAGQEFNLNSPKQISEVFFEKLGLPHAKKTKTGLSTAVDTLEKLCHDYPIAQRLLDYRELQKLLSTYIDALPEKISKVSGRVHTSFNQTIAATGRLSSTNPNLQNIPIRTDAGKEIRKAFVAPSGYRILSADYSQVELRILAHFSNDSMLIQAFIDDRDIHTQTAAAIHNIMPEFVSPSQRSAAKTINFGLMYGMGAHSLSQQLHISMKEANNFIDEYFLKFPTIRQFMDDSIRRARETGYAETLFGRRRQLSEINAEFRQVREAAERNAINTPIQGTAADIMKIAMVTIGQQLPLKFPDVKMLLQVHDELVFEVPEAQTQECSAWIAEKMSAAGELKVPLKVEVGVGMNWGEAH